MSNTDALEKLIAEQHFLLKPAGAKGRLYHLPDDRLAAVCSNWLEEMQADLEYVEDADIITGDVYKKRIREALVRANAIAQGETQPKQEQADG